ncbi:MAG TPA: macrolide ABC transporter ATP-binding protein [Elusimicrobia bacterium]|nr:macrolide ABC transporter ATP-binding protein [Elusimicrobiota bacterium]HBT61220.1 macrolide ABC transporter ATP-binding protein [Elusimicrobiota bacterium]
MSNAPLISVRHVSKTYGDGRSRGAFKVAALTGLSLDFHAGEFTAIAGPSGSGKSTLLNIIGTLDAPTSGEVLFEGRRVTSLDPAQAADFRLRALGFIFQAYNLIPVLSAVENVEYPLVLQKTPAGERRARAMEVLRWVGLESQAGRRPDLLSGGQQQRVAVARAIVHRPLVVLADEPTANLDSKTAAALLDIMEQLNREHNITLLFSSHDPAVLSRARRVVHLRDGRLVET